MRTLLAAAVLCAAIGSGACATRSTAPAVPRPFPGAALPPGSTETAEPAAPAPVVDRAPSVVAAPPGIAEIVTTALGLRGIPYVHGGSDPAGFDCSGFVQYVFGRHGLKLPREVRDQYTVGDRVQIEDVKAGDLIFFATKSSGASHVGLALGDGRFVHAPSSNGVVRVERYRTSYWARRLVGVRRVTDVRNFSN